MIEMRDDRLLFTAPDVHPSARFSLEFQRTLRVPDDGLDYPLPAGLGRFPLEHVDDHAARVPEAWNRHGGVMLPMHAAEALWLNLDSDGYPWLVKVAAGMVNAVSGERWSLGLTRGQSPQDYLVVPDQPWLDGFNSGDGVIRQFVAMPLGAGFSVEEQLTGAAEFGGIQILAYPMKADEYERRFGSRDEVRLHTVTQALGISYSVHDADMGLGAGGRIVQQIERDRFGIDVWDTDHPARCFVHLARAEQWPALTGTSAPTPPPTPQQYRAAGIPWFDYASAGTPVPAAPTLAGVASVHEIAQRDGLGLTDNDSIPVDRVVRLARRGPVVTEWDEG